MEELSNTETELKKGLLLKKGCDAIEACKFFSIKNHSFNKHAKLLFIEQLRNIKSTSTETLKTRLKKWKSFG